VTGFESLQPTLAEMLLVKRTSMKLSQQDVADATGIPRSGVSDIERGLREVSALELKAYAVLFGTTTDVLLGHEIPEPGIGTPEGLVAALEKVTSDLHGYLEQRAQELAGPRIELAEQAAAERVRQAEFQLQRITDLLDETRRQWKGDLKRAHRAEHRLDMTHPAGECGRCDEDRLNAKNAQKMLG
jgi:transcriptional regulator with XRE-family HTH domain